MRTKRLTTETDLAAELLRSGGLVALPTETVYGLGANGLDEAAVAKIFAAKGRPNDNPLILHIASAEELPLYCADIPELAYRLTDAFWPGALTLVLKRRPVVPDAVTAGLGTVAMRCPDHALTLAVIAAAGLPIAAPSANVSGRPSPTTAAHVLEDMNGKIDAIVDGGTCTIGVESTILDLTTTPPHLLRPGGVSVEEIEALIGPIDTQTRAVGAAETPVAPGMKYRHYAPRAPMTLLVGDAAQTAAYIAAEAQTADGILCFAEFAPRLAAFSHVIGMGRIGHSEEQARIIFDALRRFDALAVPHIYAQCPAETALGLAVVNRLKKAAKTIVTMPEPLAERKNESMKIIGLTGGSGTGKTTALHAMTALGAYPIDCDALYHRLLAEDAALRQALVDRFGATVAKPDGGIDRVALGAIVFGDEAARRDLGGVTGSFIKPAIYAEIAKARAAGAPAAVIDAIGLIEGGYTALADRNIAITAPLEVRHARIMQRDAFLTEETAWARLRSQKSDDFFREMCDYVLENSGTEESRPAFEAQVQALYRDILSEGETNCGQEKGSV